MRYSFDDGGGFINQPAEAAPGTSAGVWSDTAATLIDALGDPGHAISTTRWLTGNSLSTVLEMAPGATLTVTGFSFSQRASASGPSAWELRIDGAFAASGSTSGAFATRDGALSLTGLSGQVPIVLIGTGASSNSGTFRIDNFILSGTLTSVPAPAALLLATGPLAGVVLRRRCPISS